MGSGGHGAVVAEVALALGYQIAAFCDDDPERFSARVLEWKVIGGRHCIPRGAPVALAIGDNAARSRLVVVARREGWVLPALVHPAAVVSPSALLGDGTVVLAGAVVNARTRTGRACILNTACSVDHDCTLGEAVHVAPGARLAGMVTVGNRALIGVGAAVIPSIKIGNRCVIGAGSTVVRDIPDDAVAYGTPAQVHRSLSEP